MTDKLIVDPCENMPWVETAIIKGDRRIHPDRELMISLDADRLRLTVSICIMAAEPSMVSVQLDAMALHKLITTELSNYASGRLAELRDTQPGPDLAARLAAIGARR